AEEPRTCDALYDIVRSFPPFVALPRGLFDSTLEMLAGRYAGTRVRELEPRIALDRATGMVEARDGTRTLLYSSGGTIPDRGLFSLRAKGSRTRIGELDEEFVFERKVGEAFTLGAQTWRITSIGDEAVEVVPAGPDPDIVPFWKGDALFRSPEICSRSLALLDAMDDLDEEGGAELLRGSYGFCEAAARACSRFVAAQKAAGSGRASLPRTGRLVLEVNADPSRKGDTVRLVLHTLRGLAVNEVLSQCLAASWEEAVGLPVRSVADDDRVLILAPALSDRDPSSDARKLLSDLAEGGRIDSLLRSRLEGAGLFGAEFRKNAGRSLLLPRGSHGKRLPLWTTRLRAKKLFDAVKSFPDFPAIVETWRSCLADLLDPAGALELVRDVAEGRVELSCFESRVPSPLAREALWKETAEFMYSGD
ncbi:MAG: DEAD/DEAH box helicase, partial [Spirochaetaceae bacterium]|nr:DEAD/DEAH box helicase [Spirochaetaceae bacterium]